MIIEPTDIGLKSLGCVAPSDLGISTMRYRFSALGIAPTVKNRLNHETRTFVPISLSLSLESLSMPVAELLLPDLFRHVGGVDGHPFVVLPWFEHC